MFAQHSNIQLKQKRIKPNKNKQVWLDARRHESRKDHFAPILTTHYLFIFFFWGFSSTKC